MRDERIQNGVFHLFFHFLEGILDVAEHFPGFGELFMDAVHFRGNPEKTDYGFFALFRFELFVEPGKRVDVHVYPFVVEFIAGGSIENKGLRNIKTIVGEKIIHEEFPDAVALDVVLAVDLLDGGEFFDIQTVWQNDVGRTTQKIAGLQRGDLAHGREYIRQMRRRFFKLMFVLDEVRPRFGVGIQALELRVKINAPVGQTPPQRRRVRGEHRRDAHLFFGKIHQRGAGKPFVEMA